MKRLRLSWVPSEVLDPQDMVWHPFGLTHRTYEGGYQTVWYWRRYWVSIINPFHPFFVRRIVVKGVRARDWSGLRFWLSRLVRVGKG